MMHALFEAWHGLNALTTAPKHPPPRPGVRAAIMRQPLDPEQSSIHGRFSLGDQALVLRLACANASGLVLGCQDASLRVYWFIQEEAVMAFA